MTDIREELHSKLKLTMKLARQTANEQRVFRATTSMKMYYFGTVDCIESMGRRLMQKLDADALMAAENELEFLFGKYQEGTQ